MNRDETAELFLECEAKRAEAREAALAAGKSEGDAYAAAHEAAKAHWKAWAEPLLAERKAMEADGRWAAEKDWRGSLDAKNEDTRAWMAKAGVIFSHCLFLVRGGEGTKETVGEDKEESEGGTPPVKSIQLEGDRIDFDGFVFPSNASFASTTFTSYASFASATFTGPASFASATFTGPASFASATFTGPASFASATFTGPASFASATFTGPARFASTTFTSYAGFDSATFTGNAWFASATFTGNASFDSATFTGNAWFDSATFTGNASFDSATFTGNAWFDSATFTGYAGFDSATFTGYAGFASATFTGNASFDSATFTGNAWFASATFTGNASFRSTSFQAGASFYAIRGERGLDMAGAKFEAVPDFIQAHFEEAPRLDNVRVSGRWIPRHSRPERNEPGLESDESETQSEASEEKREETETPWRARWYAARHLGGRVRTWPTRAAKGAWRRVWEGDADIPARWRALKRLAIQGHDTERELEYHARELQSQRFEDDWPLPFRFWSPASWVGALRFWFGMFYGLFSDFGRSTVRPALLWFATVAVFAMYFLAGQPDVMERWRTAEPQGFTGSVAAYVKTIPALWRDPPACYAGAKGKDGQPSADLTGLVEPAAGSTNTLREAIRLAFRNGSVILDGGEDALHRTYGCLYGIERYNGNPVPFVPGFVTDASGLQKVLSALYIFLFGLALRNMLKMK